MQEKGRFSSTIYYISTTVIEEGDSSADTEARALLNKFLGATVLMAGMQNYVTEKPTGKVVIKQVSRNYPSDLK